MARTENRNGYSCRVNILKYVKVADKWRFAPAQLVNNKLKFDCVLIDGKAERHPEGTYYIEWYKDGKRRRQSVKDSGEVLEQARRKAIALDASKAGLEIAAETDGDRVRLADAVTSYLKEIDPPQREPKTYTAYKYCLELFLANCSRTYLQDVTREDVLAFIRKLYAMGCGARTAYNRAAIIAQLLKVNGIKGLLHKRDWPKFVDPIRPVYEPEELKALFAACKLEERTLLAELKAHKDHQAGNKNPRNLVFPTATGEPDKKHEWKLKRIAYKAGLNCGRCASRHGNKCADGEFCSNWFPA